jgi:hypothetical protein
MASILPVGQLPTVIAGSVDQDGSLQVGYSLKTQSGMYGFKVARLKAGVYRVTYDLKPADKFKVAPVVIVCGNGGVDQVGHIKEFNVRLRAFTTDWFEVQCRDQNGALGDAWFGFIVIAPY